MRVVSREYGFSVTLAVGLVACLLAGVTLLRPRRPAPEVAIDTAIHRFVDGLETRRINLCTRVLAADFRWNGVSRSEFSRGLFALNRQYTDLDLYLAEIHTEVAPDGRSAVSRVTYSATARQGGRGIAVGENELEEAWVRWEPRGRQWLAVEGRGTTALAGLIEF